MLHRGTFPGKLAPLLTRGFGHDSCFRSQSGGAHPGRHSSRRLFGVLPQDELDQIRRQRGRSLARAATKSDQNISQDIAASQGNNAAGMDPMLTDNMGGYQTQSRFNDWVNECMTGYGYSRVP